MKKLIVLMALSLAMAFSGSALAQEQNRDWAAQEKEWQEHREAMSQIQDKLWAKNMEYEALVGNPNAKRDEIREIIGEMTELRGQMRDERNNFAAREGGPGMGYGPGPGYGPGMGYGCPGWGGGGRGSWGRHRGGGRNFHRAW